MIPSAFFGFRNGPNNTVDNSVFLIDLQDPDVFKQLPYPNIFTFLDLGAHARILVDLNFYFLNFAIKIGSLEIVKNEAD